MKVLTLLCLVAAVTAFDNTSPAQYVAWLSAAPGVTTAQYAIGACVIRYDAASMNLGVLCHHNISSSDTVTAAHIHGPTANPATGSVGVLIPLTVAGTGPNSVSLSATAITLRQACNISLLMTYVNVHTTSAPGGLIRGAVVPAASSGWTHTATLDNVQASQGTTITASGIGLVKRSGSTLTVDLFHNLNILPPIGEHIHTSVDISIVYSCCGLLSVPFRNCTNGDQVVLNKMFPEIAAQVSNLDMGKLYFNVHTAAAPSGQIRGEIAAVMAATGPSNSQCTGAATAMQASLSLVALLAAAVTLFH